VNLGTRNSGQQAGERIIHRISDESSIQAYGVGRFGRYHR
jgi:hypothetical protein